MNAHSAPGFTRFGLGLAALALGSCYTPTVDFMPRAALVDLDGSFSSTPEGSASAGSNDFEALGLEDDEQVVFSPRIDLTSGRWSWTVDWIGNTDNGTGTVQNEFTIDGVTFESGNPVRTDARLNIYRGAVTYDFAPDPDLNLGLGLGATFYEFDSLVEDLADSDLSETDRLGVLPSVAGRAGYRVGDFDAQALVSFVTLDVSDIDATYFDADAFLRWPFRGRDEGWTGALVAGYRWIDLDANYEEEPANELVDLDIRFDGPYLGVSLGF